MPRTLPWQVASSSTTTHPKPQANTPATKRQKVKQGGSDRLREDERSTPAAKKGFSRDRGRPPSSSPPPHPPTESFMNEGKDQDDRFRMVEDEFLSVAQQFTVHLHAAEYKRQQKAVKSGNAEAINSISRPVTGKMPDQTKRKVESYALSERQRSMIEGLSGQKENGANSDDSDIDIELPYVGTTLHGLMDSPRKKASSLAKLGSLATTRAAAGFKKPAVHSNVDQHESLIDSPEPKHTARRARADFALDSTDDDDDLDAPIAAPKLVTLDRNPVMKSELHPLPSKPTTIKKEPPDSSSHIPKMVPFIKTDANTSAISTIEGDTAEVAPKPSRLERIRLARAKKEREQEMKKENNIIPSF